MVNLVPIPWQPSLLLTPDTLAYLQAACRAAGRTLYLDGEDSAWRSWDRQNYLYQGYIQGLPGFNTASSPNPPGQRNHMRGAAFDLIDTDAATQAACRSVGLVRDYSEPWHWNNPNWPNMPIIPTGPETTTAGGNATPIDNGGNAQHEEDYSMTQGAYFRLADGQPALGSLVAGTILYQSEPAEPLQLVAEAEWPGISANKNAYADISTQRMQALLNVVGMYEIDGKGRRVPAQPGRASRNGFSIYLP